MSIIPFHPIDNILVIIKMSHLPSGFCFFLKNFRNLLVVVPLTNYILNVGYAKRQKLLQEIIVLMAKCIISTPVSTTLRPLQMKHNIYIIAHLAHVVHLRVILNILGRPSL